MNSLFCSVFVLSYFVTLPIFKAKENELSMDDSMILPIFYTFHVSLFINGDTTTTFRNKLVTHDRNGIPVLGKENQSYFGFQRQY